MNHFLSFVFQKKQIFFIMVLIGFQVFSIYLLMTNKRINICRQFNFCSTQSLLSIVQGDISGQGDYIKVMKFKTKQGIRLRFIKENSQGGREIVKKVLIPHPYNGFFEYRGRAVQLGMSDVNGDGVMEILAPSFDKDLQAHLNVYQYDDGRNTFERMQLEF